MCKCSVVSAAAAAAFAAWAGAEMDVMVEAMTMKDRADLARVLKAVLFLLVLLEGALFDTLLNLMEALSALLKGTLFNEVVW